MVADRPAGEVTAEARRAGLDRVATLWASGKSAPMVIADAATDAAIGLINLQFEDDEVAKLAYSVFPEQRGRGIAPRAVRLVMGWALGELGLNRLLLEADEGNAASIRVAEKCAFQRIGTRLEDDGEHTTAVSSERRLTDGDQPTRWTALKRSTVTWTAAWRAAETSVSVRVRSGARKRRAKASDFLPSPICSPV